MLGHADCNLPPSTKPSIILKAQRKKFTQNKTGIFQPPPKDTAASKLGHTPKLPSPSLASYYRRADFHMLELPHFCCCLKTVLIILHHEQTGDKAESKMFHALKQYFEKTGDDVLIIHSHKFLHKDTTTNKQTNNEKDFIVVNVSKGNHCLFLKRF